MELTLVNDSYYVVKFVFGILIGRIFGWNYTIMSGIVTLINMKKSWLLNMYFDCKKKCLEEDSDNMYVALLPIFLGIVLFAEVSDTCLSVISVFLTKLVTVLSIFPLTKPVYDYCYQHLTQRNVQYEHYREKTVSHVIDNVSKTGTQMFMGNDSASGMVSGFLKGMINKKPSDSSGSNPMPGPFGALGGIGDLLGGLGAPPPPIGGAKMNGPPLDMASLFGTPLPMADRSVSKKPKNVSSDKNLMKKMRSKIKQQDESQIEILSDEKDSKHTDEKDRKNTDTRKDNIGTNDEREAQKPSKPQNTLSSKRLLKQQMLHS